MPRNVISQQFPRELIDHSQFWNLLFHVVYHPHKSLYPFCDVEGEFQLLDLFSWSRLFLNLCVLQNTCVRPIFDFLNFQVRNLSSTPYNIYLNLSLYIFGVQCKCSYLPHHYHHHHDHIIHYNFSTL